VLLFYFAGNEAGGLTLGALLIPAIENRRCYGGDDAT